MKTSYENFIGLYEDVYPEGYCEHLIAEFERLLINGAGENRRMSEKAPRHYKDDWQIYLNFGVHMVAPFNGSSAIDIFFDGLQRCYEDYLGQFSVLNDGIVRATHVKMQRTDPGGGYHIWHAEQNGGVNSARVLTYTLYLNSLSSDEGGETEFLYQRKRLVPQVNTMLLWPAAFTHAHRGNTVLGEQSKYIVTGWFYYE